MLIRQKGKKLQNKCEKDKQDCGDLCSETRQQVGKIMMIFGVVIAGLLGYMLYAGIFTQLLAH